MTEPVAVGLVGAGPWAHMVHAPVLAAGPETRLVGVWARRPEAAAQLARKYGAQPFASIEALFDACEAVAFAVPPGVQSELAVQAARAGKALLLEKPIAADLAGAERLADAVVAAGVPSLAVLSWRYGSAVRAFLEQAARFEALGGRGIFVSGALVEGPFATPWRLERGPLLDLGPHVIDLLDAALGPIVDVRASGNALGWVALQLQHESGVVSQASLCANSRLQPHRAGIELFGPAGELSIDCVAAVGAEAFVTMRREFAEAVREGQPHPLSAHRGLHLQRLLEAAEKQLLA
ncbi:MAG: Gfo/Idh/MocA family protein [Hyphomicrobiales bacterium]